MECLKFDKKKKKHTQVRILKTGDHFGELALINNEARSLGVRTITNCTLYKLDAETFTRILGSIESNLKKDYKKEAQV